MRNQDIARPRLLNQHIAIPDFEKPKDVVNGLVAVQAQDYAGAKWALGLRMREAIDIDIEQAFADGTILRTHVLRPTWHFVVPDDIHWLLMLTGPQVHTANAYMYRKLELDSSVFKRSHVTLEKALRGGKHLTRAELAAALKQAGIRSDDLLRFTYLIMYAELDGLICSGPRRGKQFTYTLLEERAPKARAIARDEALVGLLTRYLRTRGPATLQDFMWWSGLTMVDAKNGIEMTRSQFVSEVINGQTYWFSESGPPAIEQTPTAHLLPNYDEYFIGFKDRSAIGKVARKANVAENDSAFLAHILILDGQIVGGWKRTLKRDSVIVKLNLITKLAKAEEQAVAAAAERLGEFLELPVTLIQEAD